MRGHFINSACGEWVTTQNSFGSQPAATRHPVLSHRLRRVFRTGGVKLAAVGRDLGKNSVIWRERPLVHTDETDLHALGYCQRHGKLVNGVRSFQQPTDLSLEVS